MSQEIGVYRVLYEYNGHWEIKICKTNEELKSWMIGNPCAILIRFAVSTMAGNYSYDTKEEALAASEKIKKANEHVEVKPIRPNENIFKNLPQEAIQLIYTC